MKNSPFAYGVAVSGKAFTNREQELDKLKKNLLSGINTIIISPRRWGKSSLVDKAMQQIAEGNKEVKLLHIDLFAVSSEEEFLSKFAREVIKASSNKWEDWLQSGKAFFKQLVPKFSVGIDPMTDFTVSFDFSELMRYKDEILGLPQAIAERKKVKFIICLDEFQNLAAFSDYENLEKKMRSAWQRQKSVCYCLYGSKRHMMADIFDNSSKPFYRFGDLISLQKIQRDRWIEFILKGFESTGKSITPEAAALIADSMRNHPWYVQQLSHYTWQNAAKKAGVAEVKHALSELLRTNAPFYHREVEGLSATQINLLKAIARRVQQLTGTAAMQKYALGTPRNVSKNKTTLMNADIIHEHQGVIEFLDPAFEMWFRERFLDGPYLSGQ